MQKLLFRALFAASMFCTGGSIASAATQADPALVAAVGSSARTPTAVARDSARHPVEELTFFGLAPTMTVVELWPGGGYWTDILGPYLAQGGHYYVALPPPGNAEEDAGVKRFHARIAAEKDRLGTLHETTLGPGHFDIAPPGTADLVLTFRNLHNWMDGGYADRSTGGGVQGAQTRRHPGHRGASRPRTISRRTRRPRMAMCARTITLALAKKAGFEFVAASEVNANPRDTKDWVDGVWTLPPTLSQGEKDRARYVASRRGRQLRAQVPQAALAGRTSARSIGTDQISGPITTGEPSLNREARNGAGSTDGVSPIASSAAKRPAAGPMPKPWPEKPVATVRPGNVPTGLM